MQKYFTFAMKTQFYLTSKSIEMKILSYVAAGIMLIALGYLWASYKYADVKCAENQVLVQFCMDTTNVKGLRDNDEALQQLYVKAYQNGDSIGFSLGRDLLMNLSAAMSSNTDFGGVHIYPGMDDAGKKYLLTIPLSVQGVELPNVGSKLELSASDNFIGPCPKWCGLESRVVIHNP